MLLIACAGLVLRLVFLFWGAEIYYGTPQFFIGGDTYGWVACMQNLVGTGTYTVDPSEPAGYFFRPPGYSFFLAVFYLLTGRNIDATYQLVAFVQILLDVISIVLIFKLVLKTGCNKMHASISAAFYACYPFIIVWTPVIQAESVSIFFMLLSLWFFFSEKTKYHLSAAGIFMGIAVLTRLQIAFLPLAIVFGVTLYYRNNFYKIIRLIIPFSLAFIFTYGLWPARNYFMHNRLLFTQDLSAFDCWNDDYMGFMEYVFSVKPDFEPQYSEIINGGIAVHWPKAAYKVPGDSAKLAQVCKLCHECGLGFSVFIKNEGMVPLLTDRSKNCSAEISALWKQLKKNQVRHNPFNYFIAVPAGNLKKCFFKGNLNNPADTKIQMVSILLFAFRTLLIFSGIGGVILFAIGVTRLSLFMHIIFWFFVFWYFWLSFVYRNIEMRYLLQTDVLLLIPAAYLFCELILKKVFLKKGSAI